MGVKHCNSCSSAACTLVYLFTWVLLILGLLLFHVGVIRSVPHLKALPDNLEEGFEIVFGFSELESGAKAVERHGTEAMRICDADFTREMVRRGECARIPNPIPQWRTEDTDPKRRAIRKVFEEVLERVQKIANDKYFGVEDLKKTATELNTILQELKDMEEDKDLNRPGQFPPCAGTNQVYCEITGAAMGIVDEIGTVNGQIEKFTNHDIVKTYKDYSEYLDYLHALPYILVISALFFFCVWWKDGHCCGSAGGCCALILHLFFWLIFFVISTVVCAAGLAIKYKQDEVKVDMLNGEPTLDKLLPHIKEEYPDFWNLVFTDLEKGLTFFLNAAIIFEVFCILIVLYGLVLCCCGVYKKGEVSRNQVKPSDD